MTTTPPTAGTTDSKIRFALGQCTLGAILVATSSGGICAIALADEPDTPIRALYDRFPNAQWLGDDDDVQRLVAEVVGLIEAPGKDLPLPLDLRGTTFQQRVWHALREIPAGSTVSYSELARRIGLPQAVRAVGAACAANNLAVAIPCHRVVRNNGDLAGYRWGIARKAELLSRESKR